MTDMPDESIHESSRGRRFTVPGLWTDVMGRMGIRALQLLLIGAVTALLVFAMLNLAVVVIPALLAIILTCALWPLVHHARRVMPAVLAAWTVLFGSLLVLGGVGTGLFFSVLNQWPTLVDQAGQGFAELRDLVNGLLSNFGITIDQQQIDSGIDSVTSFVTSSDFGSGAVSTLGAAGSFITGLILLLVILFFFLKDGDRIWAFFVSWTPQHFRGKWIASGDRAVHTFGSYVRGTALIAAIDAIGITIALLILQVPLALPLGVIIFLGGFIPVIGATVAGALAILVALVANGPVTALIVLAVVVLIQQLDGNVLQPLVMAQTLNLHALVILIALTAGTVLAGVVGALLSVPLTAVAWDIIKVWTGRDRTGEFGPVEEASEQIEAAHKGRDEHHANHDPDTDEGLANRAPGDESSPSRP